MNIFGMDLDEIENAVVSIFGKTNDSSAGAAPQAGGTASKAGGVYGSDTPIATSTQGAPIDEKLGYQASGAFNAELNKRGVLGTVYPDLHDVLGVWSDTAQPFQKQYGTELNSKIYAVPGGWQIGTAYSNGSNCMTGEICSTQLVGGDVPGGFYWGSVHTHPDNSGGLDQADVNAASTYGGGGAGFVSLPNGQINGWNVGMSSPADQYIIRPRMR